MNIELEIDKQDVMDKVAQTTEYTGAKWEADPDLARERISTVDEDADQLERFWDESRADLCRELVSLVTEEGMADKELSGGLLVPTTTYRLKLKVSNYFEDALLPTMTVSLLSFFVHNIAAKWYVYTNKGEASAYSDKAQLCLDDLHRKALHKKRPPVPSCYSSGTNN